MDYTLRLKWWSADKDADRKIELSGVMDSLAFALSAIPDGEVKFARIETGNGLWSSNWRGVKFLFRLSVTSGSTPAEDTAHLKIRVGVPKDTKPFTVKVIVWNDSHEEVFTPYEEDEEMSDLDQEYCEWYICKKELRRR